MNDSALFCRVSVDVREARRRMEKMTRAIEQRGWLRGLLRVPGLYHIAVWIGVKYAKRGVRWRIGPGHWRAL